MKDNTVDVQHDISGVLKTHKVFHEDDDLGSTWNQLHELKCHSHDLFKMNIMPATSRENPMVLSNERLVLILLYRPSNHLHNRHNRQEPSVDPRLHGQPSYKIGAVRKHETVHEKMPNYPCNYLTHLFILTSHSLISIRGTIVREERHIFLLK